MLHALSRQLPENADSEAIAGTLVRLLDEIRGVMVPILGPRGVAALLQRSLHLARLHHPWLPAPLAAGDPLDETALRGSLALQDGPAARAAADCVFSSFHSVLTSLIGASLTERLFESMWTHPTSGPAAQETPP